MFLWQIRKYKLKTGNERKENICVVVISHTDGVILSHRIHRIHRISLWQE